MDLSKRVTSVHQVSMTLHRAEIQYKGSYRSILLLAIDGLIVFRQKLPRPH